jgi:hypothetical protein
MFEVMIKDLGDIQTNGANFETEQLALDWIAEHVGINSWGLPERLEVEEDGEPTGVILPAEYTITIEDISAQKAQEIVNKEARNFLNSTDWMVMRHERQIRLQQSSSLTEEEFLALEQQRSDAAASIVD